MPQPQSPYPSTATVNKLPALDFNDMAAALGLEAVAEVLAAPASEARALHPVAVNRPERRRRLESCLCHLAFRWPPSLYPIDAFPEVVRRAVEEVQAFTQAPLPLVASSALGVLSLTGQAYVDVKRAEGLTGPTSLFLLTIADSGERKSTCDKFFTEPIRDYERQQTEAAQPACADYRAALAAWESSQTGIKNDIRQRAKKGHTVETQHQALRRLEGDKPVPPRVPRLLRLDETPENLAWVLAREWPAAGVMSAEAGIVFGGHAMGKDSIMRNLALLNILWDGGTLAIGRRTTESFTVQGARFTVALQVQEATLRSFVEGSGGLARGTGFLTRFLLAWPESTQGRRLFKDAPTDWPRLSAFHQRVAELLEQPAPIDEHGSLSPVILPLDPNAKRVWIRFHDDVEHQLCTGGKLADVRDVASKAADNASRLAALFHAVESRAHRCCRPQDARGRRPRRRVAPERGAPCLWRSHPPARTHRCRTSRPVARQLLPRQGTFRLSRDAKLQRNVIPVRLRKGTALDAALKALEEAHRVRQPNDRSAEGHPDQPGPAPGGAGVTLTIRIYAERGRGDRPGRDSRDSRDSCDTPEIQTGHCRDCRHCRGRHLLHGFPRLQVPRRDQSWDQPAPPHKCKQPQ